MGGLTGGSSKGRSGGGLTGSGSGGVEGKRRERQKLLDELGLRKGPVSGANPVARALQVVDTARAAAVSAAKEADDAVPALAKLDQAVLGTKPDKFDEASLGDLVRQTKEHIGYGDLVDTGNKWVDRGLGFAGDVALDPLSYVTFGATSAANAGVRVGAKQAARKALSAGEKELAEKVLRRGVGSLAAEEAASLGVRQGATIGIGGARAAIPGTGGLARGLNVVTAPLREAALTSKVGRAAATKLSAAAEAVPSDSLVDRLQLADVTARSKAEASGLGQRHRKTLGELIRKHKGEDTAAIRRALEGQGPHTPASGELRQLLDGVANDVERVTGRVVPRLEDYLPHQATKEFKEALAEGGVRGRRKGGHFDSTLRREKRVGTKWFGRELETGSIDEMEEIAKDALGNDYRQVFKDNPWEIAHAYIAGMEREAQRGAQERLLLERGVGGATRTRVSEKPVPGAAAEQKRLLREAQGDVAASGKLTALAEGQTSALDKIVAALPDAGEVRSTAGKAKRRVGRADRLAAKADELSAALAELRSASPAELPNVVELEAKLADAEANLAAPTAGRPLTEEEVARAQSLVSSLRENDGLMSRVREFQANATAQGDERAASAAGDRLTELRSQRAAVVGELEGIKSILNPAPRKLTSAEKKAQRLVEALRDKVEHARAAVDGAEQYAAANAERLKAITTTEAKVTAVRQAEVEARAEADRLFAEAERLRGQREGGLAAIAALEGMVAKTEADAAEHSARALEKVASARSIKLTHVTSDAHAMYEDGLKQFAKDKWAEPWVAEAVLAVNNLLSPPEAGKFMRLYDTVTSRWKAYSLLSPGFHERNFMGGMFNNSLAGMDPRHYVTYARASRQLRKGGLAAITDTKVRDAFAAMDRLGILEGHNVRDLSDVAGAGSKRGLLGQRLTAVDPTNLDNAALRVNARAARAVERELRGPLFIDVFLRTGDADAAMEAVVKYHFDYSDLSSFEQRYLKRLFPFYTWTRKNFPLQLQELAARPGRYTRYLHAKRNIEAGTEADADVPSYYEDLLAIRTPFKSGSNPVYFTPDLPFRDITEVADPFRAIGQLNPLIKTPLEAAAGKQFFTDVPFTNRLTPVPKSPLWEPIAQVLRVANGKFGLPKIERGKGGTLLISDKDAYKIEQFLPLLGRMRRLVPSEERYQTRATTSWVSFVFGLGGRTLDPASQFGEVNRQVQALKALKRRREELGQ